MALVRRRTVAIGFTIVLLLLLVGWAAPIYASAHPAVVHTADSTNVVITVTDAFAFTPADFEVTPGQNVTITLESLDSEAHTLTMSPVANYSFDSSNSTNQLLGFFSTHPPLVNLSVTDTQGSTDSISFQAPALGVYEFVCLEPGHFQAGMWGDMGSGVAVGPPAAPGIPVALYIIVGVIVTLVVIAIVLGFVVGKREGSKYEMPPERLGYPEPRDPTKNPPTPLRPPTGRSPPPGY
jgi:plastocyanin